MNRSAALWQAAWERLPDYLSAHVALSLSSLGLGLAISLPLAIIASRVGWLRGILLGAASLIQTIPGLALLALFYPVLLGFSALTEDLFGLGFPALGFLPALLALTLYSMLPVLRNTVTGLAGVEASIKMAARGVGMTSGQSLRLVELPLAAPVIMAGIRTSAVWVIGMATLSTPVGQKSLGNYIFTGLQTENWVFVLFGCIAAAVLALIFDRLLALAETGFETRSRARLIGAAGGIVIIAVAGLLPLMARPATTYVIGAKTFDEQYILAAVMKDELAKHGMHATTRAGLGSAVLFRALAAGDIDAYVDYSGTIWTNYMKRTDQPGREAVLRGVKDWLAEKHGIRLLGPLGFENAYALAMTKQRADALHIHSIADLAAYAGKLKIGADFEFFGRPEWTSLVDAYGLHFKERKQYQSSFMYRALVSGEVDVISAYSSDGRIAEYGLTLLSDPRHALPPYDAILLVSPERANDARFIAALKPLVGAFKLSAMQQANLMVDRTENKKTPDEAARWLMKGHLAAPADQ